MDNETKEMFNLVLKKLGTIDNRLDTIDNRLDTMDNRLTSVEKRQDEIFTVVKAIEHSNQVLKAEFDNFNLRVSHLEGTINAVGELINKRRLMKIEK